MSSTADKAPAHDAHGAHGATATAHAPGAGAGHAPAAGHAEAAHGDDHGGGGGHDEGGGHDGGHGGHGGGHGKHGDAPVDRGPSAPLWLLSFADMMTNLLCFFILLSAFASRRDGLLLEDGLGSMQQQFGARAAGMLDGSNTPIQFHAGRVVYRAAKSINSKDLVDASGHVIDANRDTMRDVMLEAMAAPKASVLPTPLMFEAGSVDLTAGHQEFLRQLVRYAGAATFAIRIDGYSFEDAAADEDGWAIGEARARKARDFLIANGVNPARLRCVGHGMLRMGRATRADAPALPQNSWGRRSVVLTFLH